MEIESRQITIGYWDNRSPNCNVFIRMEFPGLPDDDIKALAILLNATDSVFATEWQIRTGDIVKFEDNQRVFLAKEEDIDSIGFFEITKEFV